MVKIIFLIILLTAIIPCSAAQVRNELPGWINALIRKFEAEEVGNPPRSIWQYEYKGQIVYYLPEQCCDLGSELYSRQGTKICSPDGGYAGIGDGKCSDFLDQRKNEKLIWKDSRKHD